MKVQLARAVAVALLTMFFVQSTFATCGGGGGGGGGGVSGSSSGGASAPVYPVPWKARKANDAPATGLVLYWFPASDKEVNASSLRQSRILSLYATQCVSMELADGRNPHAESLIGASQLPIAALAKPDGTLVGKVENAGGKLKVADV